MSENSEKESQVPDSIFRVKPGTDPFRIYGVELDEDDEALEELDGPDDSTKVFLRQEMFSHREKFFAELDSAVDVGPDLEDLVRMVGKDNSSQGKRSAVSTKTKYHKANVSTSDQIRMGLAHVDVTFSRIFQALLVLIDNSTSPLSSARVGVPEIERASRRSREFNVRLGRLSFELKQRVLYLLVSTREGPSEARIDNHLDCSSGNFVVTQIGQHTWLLSVLSNMGHHKISGRAI